MLKFGPNRQLPSSPFLNFDSKKLGSSKIMKLLKELEELKTIKILLLSDNDIDDSAIPAIVALISNPKVSLERLDLGGNNITEEGAKKLLAAAKEKESLCELVLSGNPEISDECIKEVETLMETREKKKRSASPS